MTNVPGTIFNPVLLQAKEIVENAQSKEIENPILGLNPYNLVKENSMEADNAEKIGPYRRKENVSSFVRLFLQYT